LPSVLGAILKELKMTYPNSPHGSNDEANDAPMNPFSREGWNLTGQAKIFNRDQAEADRLARAGGHRDAATSRLKNAR
jgi:hypothetical protein